MADAALRGAALLSAAALVALARPAAAQVAPPVPPGAPAAPPAAPAAPPGVAPAAPPGAASWGAAPAPPGAAPGSMPPGWPASPLGAPEPPWWVNPKVIEYEEGDPIPPGYALRTRANRALLISGLTLFGTSYGASLAVGSVVLSTDDREAEKLGTLLVPLAGPYITVATSDAEGAGIFWLIVDGVMQAGGVVLIAAGLANETEYLERQGGLVRGRPAASLRPEVTLGPAAATLRWRF